MRGSMPKIIRNVLSNKVYIALKEMIINHRFQPGTRLNVEKISKELEVSRTPVWEAVRRLQQEGLVENIPYRGVFMVEMTLGRALELYQVREALEGLAARLAAPHANEKTLEKMSETLENQEGVIQKGDLLGYSRSDFEFHSLIHKMSRNSVLQEMLESLKTKMQPITMEVKPILPRLYEDHLEILETIRSKDPDKSERILRRHNRVVQNQIQMEIERSGGKGKES
jgi:DNA-binding GntR family transcriptional regulator